MELFVVFADKAMSVTGGDFEGLKLLGEAAKHASATQVEIHTPPCPQYPDGQCYEV